MLRFWRNVRFWRVTVIVPLHRLTFRSTSFISIFFSFTTVQDRSQRPSPYLFDFMMINLKQKII